jgi:hypothetical protein
MGRADAGAIEGMTWNRWPDERREAQGRRHAHLTDEDVREIRRRRGAGERRNALARAFSIDPSAISNIVAGRTYRWVQ